MRRFLFIFSLLFPFFSYGQQANDFQVKFEDSIIITFSEKYGKFFEHHLKAKETIYSLSKALGSKPSDIKDLNPDLDMNLTRVGQKVFLPFSSQVLVKSIKEMDAQSIYKPVYYRVKAKDNVYRIAKVYFGQSIENVLDINNMSDFNLKIGQIIQVGWIKQNDYRDSSGNSITHEVAKQQNPQPEIIPEKISPIEENPEGEVAADPAFDRSDEEISPEAKKSEKKAFGKIRNIFKKKSEKKDIKEVVILSEQLEENEKFKDPVERKKELEQKETTNIPNPEVNLDQKVTENKPPDVMSKEAEPKVEEIINYRYEKGIAIWNQRSTDTKKLFVLHPTAKVGSYVEIENPMMKTKVQAKVVGNIPPRTYTDDVSIVVSPRVAKMLGAMDRRFMVKIKYIE